MDHKGSTATPSSSSSTTPSHREGENLRISFSAAPQYRGGYHHHSSRQGTPPAQHQYERRVEEAPSAPLPVKGFITHARDGMLPACECKECGHSKTRNSAIQVPTSRYLAYVRSGKGAPKFYRMAFGSLSGAQGPLLHALSAKGFGLHDNIGPGRFESELVDPCVGTDETNVDFFRFKMGIYNWLVRAGKTLAAETWALLNSTFERTSTELYELLQARRPGLARLFTQGDLEAALNETLIPLALAVVPKHADAPSKAEVPGPFREFVQKNLEGGEEIVADFADQLLCQIRQARMVKTYQAECRHVSMTMRGERELDGVVQTYSMKFRDAVYTYLARLLELAWGEVRDTDDVKLPIFLAQDAIDVMLADVLAGAPEKLAPKFHLSVVNKPAPLSKKRLLPAREEGEVPAEAVKHQRREGEKDVGDSSARQQQEVEEEEEEAPLHVPKEGEEEEEY